MIPSNSPGKVVVTDVASSVCHVATHTYHSVVHNKHAPVQHTGHNELSAENLKPSPGMHRRRNDLPYWHLLLSQGNLGLHN